MVKSSSKSSEAVIIRLANKSALSDVFELPLDTIKACPEDFRHREESDLDADKAAMKVLRDSLQTEGLLEPLIVFKDIQVGAYVQITGHRRRAAIEQLADSNASGFTRTMLIKVREVLGGTREDCLLFSALDNNVREPESEFHKIHSTVKFIQAGIDHARIKYSTGVQDTTFERCCRLAANPWMLGHIERNEVSLTNAHLFLEAAGGAGGPAAVEKFRKDFAREVAVRQAAIIVKRADLASRDKELSKADSMVKNAFPDYVNKAWVAQLKRGERIRRQVKYRYGASIEKDRNGKRVVIPAVNLAVTEPNLEKLAEVALRLDRVLKILKSEVNAIARQRTALRESGGDEDSLSADYASAGLDAVADLYKSSATADTDLDDTDLDETATKAKVDELLAQLGPDDGDPLDREQTQTEINANNDREEAARVITPAIADLDVPTVQPDGVDAD